MSQRFRPPPSVRDAGKLAQAVIEGRQAEGCVLAEKMLERPREELDRLKGRRP